jgi:hypothetical protein
VRRKDVLSTRTHTLPVAAGVASLAASVTYWRLRPDVVQGGSFLFGDEGANLFVGDALHRGQQLYTAVAYPYGPLPIHVYAVVSAVLGNTPHVYLAVMALLSALSVAAAALAIRRGTDTVTGACVAVLGLLPTMPLPGATIGGYTASVYYPLERLGILGAALLWTDPRDRRPWRSALIGVTAAICQGVRFGTGVVVLAAIVLLDGVVAARDPAARRRAALATAAVIGGFVLVEGGWLIWAFATLPAHYALEFAWPVHMWQTHQASGEARWPTWAGWRMGLTQYLMPVIAAVLSAWGMLRFAAERDRPDRTRPSGACMAVGLFFLVGALGFFRNEHHFRQFGWVLPVAAAPAVASLQRRWRLALAVACLPALWPFASALTHRKAPDIVRVDTPRGFALYLSPAAARRVVDLAPYARGGPVLFVPNGAGWLYAYGAPHVSRHTWFYSPAAVRPFEESIFEAEAARARTLVRCPVPAATAPWPFPPSVVTFLEERFRPAATAADCAIWPAVGPRPDVAPGR